MAGRWSVWNNSAVQQIAENLVPAADEVWRLQRGNDPEARFFQGVAKNGHYTAEGQTRQGIYVISPGGQLLASVNSLDPEVVLATVQRGIDAWEALPDGARNPAAEDLFMARSRWEDAYPAGGLVLRAMIRDLPGEDGADRVQRYNLDHVWVGKAELADRFRDDLKRGDTIEWPELAQRLARFHLVDSALGQTLPYAKEELTEATLSLTVEEIQDGVALLGVTGATAAVADGEWRLGDNDWAPKRSWPRSMTVSLLGSAQLKLEAREFTSFDLIGVGAWTGRTRFNGRGSMEEPVGGRIGFAFNLAPDTPTERVAPAFVDIYDALPVRSGSDPSGSDRKPRPRPRG